MSALVLGAGKSPASEALFAALICTIPGVVWLIGVGDIIAYFTHRLPQGQLLYVFSKLCGLYAFFFMTVQIIIGIQGRKSSYFKYHQRLGMLTTLTVSAHVALFVIAASVRSGHWEFDYLVPIFSQGFYKSAVSLGVIAVYFLSLALLATLLRGKSQNIFKWIHRTAFVVGALGWLHSFLIGTETGIPAVMIFYTTLLGIAGYFLLRKVIASRAVPQNGKGGRSR